MRFRIAGSASISAKINCLLKTEGMTVFPGQPAKRRRRSPSRFPAVGQERNIGAESQTTLKAGDGMLKSSMSAGVDFYFLDLLLARAAPFWY